MHAAGFDLQRRPVIYSCNGMASAKDYKSNEDHMINCFEHTVKLMPPGVEKWVWVSAPRLPPRSTARARARSAGKGRGGVYVCAAPPPAPIQSAWRMRDCSHAPDRL